MYEHRLPRARIGFILPAVNRVAEPEFKRFLPPDVEPHFTRLRMTGKYQMALPELLVALSQASACLGDTRCNLNMLQCTGTSMGYGAENERRMVAAMEESCGIAATTTGLAILAALDALAAKRLVFISREEFNPNNRQVAYLEAAGHEIIGASDGGADGRKFSATISPQLWRDVALRARDDRADAYFLSCADSRGSEVIGELETALDRPVISSNQAALWHAMRVLGLHEDIPGYGMLFKTAGRAQSQGFDGLTLRV